jgi:hypothetical protein
MACPPSVKLEAGFPDTGSEYAAEGTQAHDLAERWIQLKLKGPPPITKGRQTYPQDMQDCIDEYTDWVVEFYNRIRHECEDAILLTERRLDFSKWVPGGFGTGDVVIIADGTIHIIDLKYGKGVPVSADHNPQLMLYGLGAITAYDLVYEFDKVDLIINQPRLDSISVYSTTVEELLTWGEEVVKPAAKMAMKGEGDQTPGEHCRFCKAAPVCRARASEAARLAAEDFGEPETLTDEEIADMLGKLDRIVDYCGRLKEYTLAEALRGKKWNGYKVVEGKSCRKYGDELAVAEKLKEAGYEEASFYEKKLLGITAMEKMLGKKEFNEVLGSLVVKPAGAPVLVPADDKRPEYTGADDFKEEE